MARLQGWQQYWEQVPKPIRNKFAMVTIFFVLWMAFLDRNSFLAQYYMQTTLQELSNKKMYFLDEIKQSDIDHQELFTNDASMEKFARERYMMKKSNEDLFIVMEEKTK